MQARGHNFLVNKCVKDFLGSPLAYFKPTKLSKHDFLKAMIPNVAMSRVCGLSAASHHRGGIKNFILTILTCDPESSLGLTKYLK